MFGDTPLNKLVEAIDDSGPKLVELLLVNGDKKKILLKKIIWLADGSPSYLVDYGDKIHPWGVIATFYWDGL